LWQQRKRFMSSICTSQPHRTLSPLPSYCPLRSVFCPVRYPAEKIQFLPNLLFRLNLLFPFIGFFLRFLLEGLCSSIALATRSVDSPRLNSFDPLIFFPLLRFPFRNFLSSRFRCRSRRSLLGLHRMTLRIFFSSFRSSP